MFQDAISTLGKVVWGKNTERGLGVIKVEGGLMSKLLPVYLLLFGFIMLKLAGFITWSWWWVFSPVWIPVCVVCCGVLGFILKTIYQSCLEQKRIKRMQIERIQTASNYFWYQYRPTK